MSTELLSKEEIFKASCDWYLLHPDDVLQGLGHRKSIIERSMDEYAKQEAIGFWDWVGECDYTKSDGTVYIDKNPHGIKGGYYTPEQLYNLYYYIK